jgi:hypothetical protein
VTVVEITVGRRGKIDNGSVDLARSGARFVLAEHA